MRSSVKFFDLDVDIQDSDKYYELFDDAVELPGGPYATFGRLILVLTEIYKHGFALRLTKARRGRLARDLGLSGDELALFLDTVVDAGWFDARLYGAGILTSVGIQERFAKVFRRRRIQLSDEERSWWLLDGTREHGDANKDVPNATSRGHVAADCGQIAADRGQVAADCAQEVPKRGADGGNSQQIAADCRPDKKREEEKRLDEKRLDEKREEEPVGDSQVAIGPTPQTRPPSSSSTSDPSEPPSPGCLASHAKDPPGCFLDSEGRPHRTMAGAVMASWAEATGLDPRGQRARDFARDVSSTCPAGCDRGEASARTCLTALIRACEVFDPERASSVAPLAKRILRDERG